MPLRNPRAERNRQIALKAWLKQMDAWDGVAMAFHPALGRIVNMDEYKRRAAEPQMRRIDSMPPEYRALVHEFQDVGTIWDCFQQRLPVEVARGMLS